MARRAPHRRGWESIRARVLKRDRVAAGLWSCAWCSTELFAEQLHVDHVVPVKVAREQGWTEAQIRDLANLAVSCAPCNLKRGGRLGPPKPNTRIEQLRAAAQARPLTPAHRNGGTVWNLGGTR